MDYQHPGPGHGRRQAALPADELRALARHPQHRPVVLHERHTRALYVRRAGHRAARPAIRDYQAEITAAAGRVKFIG